MKKQPFLICFAPLLVIALTAAVLQNLHSLQRLGAPGVRLAQIPIHNPDGRVVGTTSVDLPERVLSCTSTQMPITEVELNYLPADTTFGRRRYVAPDGFLCDINVVLMGTDRTSIHKPQYCLYAQGFTQDQTVSDFIEIEKPHRYRLPVTKIITTKEVEGPDHQIKKIRAFYVYWFVTDDEITADHLTRMWSMAKKLIFTGTLQRWAYISYLAPCFPGQEEITYSRMRGFIAASAPEFQLPSSLTADSFRPGGSSLAQDSAAEQPNAMTLDAAPKPTFHE